MINTYCKKHYPHETNAKRTKAGLSARNANLCTQNNTISAQKPPHIPKTKQKMPTIYFNPPAYFISIVNV